ncbi:MAG TPA: hypothetical protein VFX37_10030 [Pseudolabrys sp.]|nr:hypothetical protein [Pseudolabrys sp.]
MKLASLSCISVLAIAVLLGPWNSTTASEPSTRHKRHAHHRVHARVYSEYSPEAARRAYYQSLEPYRSMDFRGEFPGNCAVQRAAGECMIDLGYGRCESCSVGGPP